MKSKLMQVDIKYNFNSNMINLCCKIIIYLVVCNNILINILFIVMNEDKRNKFEKYVIFYKVLIICFLYIYIFLMYLYMLN